MTDDTSNSALRPAAEARPSPPSWPWSNAIAKANNIIWRLCKGVSPQQIYDALDAEGLRIIEKEHDNSPDVLAALPAGGAGDEGEAPKLDAETIQTLLDLLNPLHGELDRQTYDQKRENFDAPDDAEWSVNVTARMERDLTQAVLILENRLRDPQLAPAPIKPSAPAFNCSHNSGESDPAVTQDCAGADTPIFDAIAAATKIGRFGSLEISVSRFIEVFNEHRDRALCTSLATPSRAVEKAGEPDPEASLPTYGNLPWDQLGRDVMEAMTAHRNNFDFDPKFYPGHQSPGINFNSLARIVDKYRLAATPSGADKGGLKMDGLKLKVLDAAREWLTERQPRDRDEKALFAAILRAYPDDAHTKESCDCGNNECEECPTTAQVEAMVRACEVEAQS
jgi:hypothetical protein